MTLDASSRLPGAASEGEGGASGSDVDSARSWPSHRVNVFDQFKFTGRRSPDPDRKSNDLLEGALTKTRAGSKQGVTETGSEAMTIR